jgi:cyclophilin family peptidyl-prolyl cis-trans isomerase
MSLNFMSQLAMSFSFQRSNVTNCGLSSAIKRQPTLPRLLGMLLLVGCLASSLPAVAQLQITPRGDNGSGTKSPGSANRNSDTDGASDEYLSPGQVFRMMLDRIRQNEADINHLYSTMPLGFPARQKEQMDTIDRMVAQTAQLRAGLPKAAIEAFKADPGKDPAATQFVFRTLNEMIEPSLPESSFDPAAALEIVDTLIDAGADQDVVVLSKGFRASFAIDDFDRASLMLDRISDAHPESNLSQIRQVVDEMKEKWQRELMIRRLEKNNDNLPRVKFETSAGEFVVELFEDHAPNTVANFISLVEKNFYNDLTFHYVKPGEYIHTGCPNGDGSGGPGYAIESEFNREQIRDYFSGTLGMANTGPETEGSQFVITHQAIPQLNGQFTAFGRVIEGFDLVRNAKAIDPQNAQPDEDAAASEPVRIIKASVLRKRDHDYEPERVAKSKVDAILDGLDGAQSDSDDLFAPRSASEDVPAIDGGGLFSPGNP